MDRDAHVLDGCDYEKERKVSDGGSASSEALNEFEVLKWIRGFEVYAMQGELILSVMLVRIAGAGDVAVS